MEEEFPVRTSSDLSKPSLSLTCLAFCSQKKENLNLEDEQEEEEEARGIKSSTSGLGYKITIADTAAAEKESTGHGAV